MCGRLLVLPYKLESEGSKSLADALGVKRIIPSSDSKFVARDEDTIINWGNSSFIPKARFGESPTILNPQKSVAHSVNKLQAMKLFENHGVSIPDFRTTIESARRMFTEDEMRRVFCRTVLTGSGGEGIHIARKPEELTSRCQLFVEGIPKLTEYRVHVLGRNVISYQEKRRRNGAKNSDDYDPAVRNLENGWVYVREGVTITDKIREEAINAVAALDLTFGAVDLAIDKRDKSIKVFEVNTSPGLEGQTLTDYTNAFKKYLKV